MAIVDYDVHHGNGTQAAFYEDPTVLFVSSHQYPVLPGHRCRRRDGPGRWSGLHPEPADWTVGAPMPTSCRATSGRHCRRWNAFGPSLLMISAGFDAHERDPLAGCRMSTDGFRALTALLVGAADRLCEGRVVLVTEGGYDLDRRSANASQAVIDVAWLATILKGSFSPREHPACPTTIRRISIASGRPIGPRPRRSR